MYLIQHTDDDMVLFEHWWEGHIVLSVYTVSLDAYKALLRRSAPGPRSCYRDCHKISQQRRSESTVPHIFSIIAKHIDS